MIENELRDYLKNLGASLVEFADLSEIDVSSRKNMPYGIIFSFLFFLKITLI